MNLRRTTFIGYYCCTAAVIALLLGSSNWLTYYRLATSGIASQGTVTKTDCTGTPALSYQFAVDGRTIAGSGSAGYGNPPCATLKPGDQVLVHYLSASPSTNLPGDPKELLGNETTVIAMAALFTPLVLLFVIFLVLRRIRSSRREPAP
jgi:hypothetical protein